MANITGNVNETARECIDKLSISFDELATCANSLLGNQLLYGSGAQTSKLIPRKTYVPWIVVNNMHTAQMQTEAESNLTAFICNQYKVDCLQKNNFFITPKTLVFKI